MLLERRLREWLDIRGKPQAVKTRRSAAITKLGLAVETPHWMCTYCAQRQDQDQGKDVHECVVGTLLARATLRFCVGHIVALRKLSQEPFCRKGRPGDVYAHTAGRGQYQQHVATSNEMALCWGGRADGRARRKHTHRSQAGSGYPSCSPDRDNRDAMREAWSSPATMMPARRIEGKWNRRDLGKLSHIQWTSDTVTKGPSREVFSAEELTRRARGRGGGPETKGGCGS